MGTLLTTVTVTSIAATGTFTIPYPHGATSTNIVESGCYLVAATGRQMYVPSEVKFSYGATAITATLNNGVIAAGTVAVYLNVPTDTGPEVPVANLAQTVASAAAPALDCSLGNVVFFATGANATCTWGAPTNVPAAGQEVTIIITQDGTGGRAIAWNAAYIFPTAWTNTGNTANLVSEISFRSNGAKLVAMGANVWHAA